MKFTILVAAYNATKFLPRCLDSLFAQTEKSVQVICIDDCSTDDSLAMQQGYTKYKDNCILVVRTPENSGQAEARNLGLQYAVGELTMMVDADDWLAPDCLEKMWEAYQSYDDVDCVVNNVILDDGTRQWPYAHPSNPVIPRVMTGHEACLYAIDWRLHGYCAVRTSLHKKYPYDTTTRIYSDDNTCRIHYLLSRRVVMSEGTYYYFQHTASCTHSPGNYKRLLFVRANMSLRQQLEHHDIGEEGLRICESHCWGIFEGVYRQMQDYKRDYELDDDVVAEIDETLREGYEAMRLERLGKRRLPYSLFRFKQWAIRTVKHLIGRE